MWPFKFPYTNFHEINLDWLLENVKSNQERISANELKIRLLGGDDPLNAIHPVGSFFISADDVSPAALFGGTWEQIKGRFLIGTGANDANTDETYGSLTAGTVNMTLGEMGGEDRHVLTVDELAKHTHYLVYGTGDESFEKWDALAAGVLDADENRGRAAPKGAGNNAPHNNMPPYLAVNMWKRVS